MKIDKNHIAQLNNGDLTKNDFNVFYITGKNKPADL